MAAITFADWTCFCNGCINPISTLSTPTHKDYSVHQSKLPFAWSLAAKIIQQLGLSFVATDLHHITDGFIGIRHLAKLNKVLFPNELQLPSRNITNLERAGYKTLNSIGHLVTPSPSLTF